VAETTEERVQSPCLDTSELLHNITLVDLMLCLISAWWYLNIW